MYLEKSGDLRVALHRPMLFRTLTDQAQEPNSPYEGHRGVLPSKQISFQLEGWSLSKK